MADAVKHAYYTGSETLAALHRDVAELAAAGHLDHDAAMLLQDHFLRVHQSLYGALLAVRPPAAEDEPMPQWPWQYDEQPWDYADYHYSDHSPAMSRQPDMSACDTPAVRQHMLSDGAPHEFPRGYRHTVNPPPHERAGAGCACHTDPYCEGEYDVPRWLRVVR